MPVTRLVRISRAPPSAARRPKNARKNARTTMTMSSGGTWIALRSVNTASPKMTTIGIPVRPAVISPTAKLIAVNTTIIAKEMQ